MKNALLSPRHFSKYQADSSFSTQMVSAQGVPFRGAEGHQSSSGLGTKAWVSDADGCTPPQLSGLDKVSEYPKNSVSLLAKWAKNTDLVRWPRGHTHSRQSRNAHLTSSPLSNLQSFCPLSCHRTLTSPTFLAVLSKSSSVHRNDPIIRIWDLRRFGEWNYLTHIERK